jgi:hypothetical protein
MRGGFLVNQASHMGAPALEPGSEVGSAGAPRLPDFLCIGAMRCGTTTLWDMLAQHPGIFMAEQKELHFFDNRDGFFDQGPAAYARHFASARPDQVRGESTPSYLFIEEACERIRALLPRVRLIAVLRDPVERARSHYWFSVRQGVEPLSIERALDAEPQRLKARRYENRIHHSYVARGRYAEQLQRYERAFGRDALCVIFLEELKADPRATLACVFRHIGVEPLETFESASASEKNPGMHPRLRWLHCLARRLRDWSGAGRALHRRAARRFCKIVDQFNLRPGTPPLPPAVRARLEREFEEPDRALERWLGRPLPWREAGRKAAAGP